MHDHSGISTQLLTVRGQAQERLHGQAREAATEHFGRSVFLRGVVELSNYCRENCHYCGMRRDNTALARFRANHDQVAELLVHHRPATMTDVNIQTGEDPVAVRELVIPLVRTIRKHTPLGVSVCLGSLSEGQYDELRAAGATIYIIKFEMPDELRYAELAAPGNLAERLSHIRMLARKGWKVSSGFIAGLPGQSTDELFANFKLARELPLVGCSVSPFISGEATPMANDAAGDIEVTLNCMAMLRLMRPDWVIPAVSALNLAAPGSGYRRGLRTGANLVTMNLTPREIRGDYLLYKRNRFIMTEEKILNAIAAEGLVPSKQSLSDFYGARVNGSARSAREATVA